MGSILTHFKGSTAWINNSTTDVPHTFRKIPTAETESNSNPVNACACMCVHVCMQSRGIWGYKTTILLCFPVCTQQMSFKQAVCQSFIILRFLSLFLLECTTCCLFTFTNIMAFLCLWKCWSYIILLIILNTDIVFKLSTTTESVICPALTTTCHI